MDIPQNIEPTAVQPFDFGLSAYPNPFNAATTIALALPQTNHVTLLLYDIQGRLVKTLADGTFSAGTHDISLDFTNRPSGIYFAEMRTPIRSRIVKLVVLK
ncbi:MAG: T9SS type A sorting domain-containing protein [Calditrichota bacterium]